MLVEFKDKYQTTLVQLGDKEQELRLVQKALQETTDEFSKFAEYLDNANGLLGPGIVGLDDASAINMKIEELQQVASRAESLKQQANPTHCSLCKEGFSALMWKHECRSCRQTFCKSCCSFRHQLPIKKQRKLCIPCGAAELVLVRAERLAVTTPNTEAEDRTRRMQKKRMNQYNLQRFVKAEDAIIYLISSNWVVLWKRFVNEGGPSPGPISNNDLLKADGSIRLNLVAVEHYRGLNYMEWSAFYDWYGGGPVLRRRVLDIYAPPAMPRVAHEEASIRRKQVRKIKLEEGDAPARRSAEEKAMEAAKKQELENLENAKVYVDVEDTCLERLLDFDHRVYRKTRMSVISVRASVSSTAPHLLEEHKDEEHNTQVQQKAEEYSAGRPSAADLIQRPSQDLLATPNEKDEQEPHLEGHTATELDFNDFSLK
eukprot:gb/GEZN01002054.1/.p1 GENE.gb/GEZN01002054.1/~~gb/GEZN01002054.1/.p1  ORF type:complete len:429 (-),score=68.84 gb/GEZN01002054.1/:295-1581(-)